jgi:hypothetical protein
MNRVGALSSDGVPALFECPARKRAGGVPISYKAEQKKDPARWGRVLSIDVGR